MIQPSPPAVAVAWQFTVAFPQPMPNVASALCTTAEVIFATAGRPISSAAPQHTCRIPRSAVTALLFYRREGLFHSAVVKKVIIPSRTSASKERSLLNVEIVRMDLHHTCVVLDTFSLVTEEITLGVALLKVTTAPSLFVSVARYTSVAEAMITILPLSSAVVTCRWPVTVASQRNAAEQRVTIPGITFANKGRFTPYAIRRSTTHRSLHAAITRLIRGLEGTRQIAVASERMPVTASSAPVVRLFLFVITPAMTWTLKSAVAILWQPSKEDSMPNAAPERATTPAVTSATTTLWWLCAEEPGHTTLQAPCAAMVRYNREWVVKMLNAVARARTTLSLISAAVIRCMPSAQAHRMIHTRVSAVVQSSILAHTVQCWNVVRTTLMTRPYLSACGERKLRQSMTSPDTSDSFFCFYKFTIAILAWT